MTHNMSKKPPTKETISTLADTELLEVRCHACGHELPVSTPAELFETSASRWVVVECPVCNLCTPFRLEMSA